MAAMLSGNVNSQLPGVVKTLDDLGKKAKQLQNTGKNITGFQKAAQDLEASRQKLVQAQAKVKELRTEITHTENPSKSMKKAFTEANEEAARLQATVQKNERTLGEYRNALSAAGVNVNNLAQAHNNLQSQTEKVTAAQNKLINAQEKYASIKSQLFDWGNIKADFMKASATVLALKQPVMIDMEFEQAMANVKAVMYPLEEEFVALRNQSLELGRTTQFSASQAAASQENLARAGFTTKEILDTMPGLLSMAAAEGMDLSQAAVILAGGLRGMNLDMTETMRLADAFAYTSAHSATNIANLGEAFKAVAATASLQGASPEQLLSYLGILANLQVEAGEAGNAIKSAFMRLSNPAAEAKKVFAQFGIQVVKDGKMRELANLLDELYTKTEKLGEAEQLKAFSIVFGKNYGDSLIKLARGVVSGDQEKLLQGLKTEKTGASNSMASVRNDTLKGDLTALSSAWEGFNIAIGKPLQEEFRKIVQLLTAAISKVTEFIDANKKIIEPVIKIGAALASWSVIATAYKYGKLIVSLPFAKLNVLLAESAAKAALSGNSFSILGSIFNALGHPIAALKSAFSLLWGVVAAHPFMALIAICGAIYYYWDDIYSLWQKSLLWFSQKWEEFKAWWDNFQIPDIFAPLIEYYDRVANYIRQKWTEFTGWIASINPFKNWGAPAAKSVNIGGVNHETGGSMQVQNALKAINGFATGGIVHNHSVIQVAEKGPEMIIPLTDKSRGLSLLTQTAKILGVGIQSDNPEKKFLNWPNIQSGNNASFINIARSEGTESFSEKSFSAKSSSLEQNSMHNYINHNENFSRISNDYSQGQRPILTFNISVSGNNNNDESIAMNIAAKVREVIANIQEYEERVEFA